MSMLHAVDQDRLKNLGTRAKGKYKTQLEFLEVCRRVFGWVGDGYFLEHNLITQFLETSIKKMSSKMYIGQFVAICYI